MSEKQTTRAGQCQVFARIEGNFCVANHATRKCFRVHTTGLYRRTTPPSTGQESQLAWPYSVLVPQGSDPQPLLDA